MSQWVQHISGQGEKWKVVEARYTGANTWMAKNADVENDNVDLLYLPKSEYRLCEPPEQWVDVTVDCGWIDEQSGERGGVKHYGPSNAVCTVYGGYRLRKVRVEWFSGVLAGEARPGWAFVIERKQP